MSTGSSTGFIGKRARKLLLLAIVTLRTGGSQRSSVSICAGDGRFFARYIKINSQFGVPRERREMLLCDNDSNPCKRNSCFFP